jgi:hypothetical protein
VCSFLASAHARGSPVPIRLVRLLHFNKGGPSKVVAPAELGSRRHLLKLDSASIPRGGGKCRARDRASFVLAGIASAFAGLRYAEMASTVPVAGSAYTYAYATMGELIAWIIRWDLILKYAHRRDNRRDRLVRLCREPAPGPFLAVTASTRNDDVELKAEPSAPQPTAKNRAGVAIRRKVVPL